MFLSDHDLEVVAAGLPGRRAGRRSRVRARCWRRGSSAWSRALRDERPPVRRERRVRRARRAGPAELHELVDRARRAPARGSRESREREQRLGGVAARAGRLGLPRPAHARWPGCARWPRRWRTGWPTTRPATTAQMRAEVDRMVAMVDDLFELSRIHAGALQPVAAERRRWATWSPRPSPAPTRSPAPPASGSAGRSTRASRCAPTRPGCPASWPTWSSTPSGTRPADGVVVGHRPRRSTTAWSSRSPTGAAASPRTTSPASSTSAWRGTQRAHARGRPEPDRRRARPGHRQGHRRGPPRQGAGGQRDAGLPVPGAAARLSRRESDDDRRRGHEQGHDGDQRPARRVRTVEQGRVVRPRPEPAEHRDRQQRHRSEHDERRGSRPRQARGAASAATTTSTITSGASTRSCSTTPATSQVATSTRSPSRRRAAAARRTPRRRRRRARAGPAGHASTSSRLTHLVCSTPGRLGAMIRHG